VWTENASERRKDQERIGGRRGATRVGSNGLAEGIKHRSRRSGRSVERFVARPQGDLEAGLLAKRELIGAGGSRQSRVSVGVGEISADKDRAVALRVGRG